MARRFKHTVRSGATAVAAATGLTMLAYTGQTTDGFVHANFTGPLSVFGGTSAMPTDVVAIGDGVADASELSQLLKATAPKGSVGDSPVAVHALAAAGAESAVTVEAGGTTGSATVKQSLQLPGGQGQVVNAQGQANCDLALSCVADPATNTITMTFADGLVAVVQKVNDLTLVAYKSVSGVLKSTVDALSLPGQSLSTTLAALAPPALQLPTFAPATTPAPAPLAAAALPTPVTAPATQSPSPDVVAPAPTPVAAPDITAATIRPRVTVSRAPQEFGAPRTGNPTGTSTSPVNPNSGISAVTGALDTVVNAVKGALSPGAASNSTTPGRPHN